MSCVHVWYLDILVFRILYIMILWYLFLSICSFFVFGYFGVCVVNLLLGCVVWYCSIVGLWYFCMAVIWYVDILVFGDLGML